MSWDRKENGRKYYYRNRRDENGRAVKEYVGQGRRAVQAEREDQEARLQRLQVKQQWQTIFDELDDVNRPVKELVAINTLLMRAVLIVNGFYLHRGHEWRRRR
ncbi:hypothetical protein Pan216_03950 [Planctomycetes bacterium Pan216]|uniref:Uncharacterized protein n=1 Tax=Kolteria novifilia TaxID=2527975 RepID=A0A518AXW0_9BACT|nr:hypothetical protein Pan216_03950 [Planctomycetes bacterium Pan216]